MTELSSTERETADRLIAEPTGIDIGEAQVLAVGKELRLSVVLAERRGRSVARQLGIETRDVIEVLFAGTADDDLLRNRLRRLAGLIDLRVADYEAIQPVLTKGGSNEGATASERSARSRCPRPVERNRRVGAPRPKRHGTSVDWHWPVDVSNGHRASRISPWSGFSVESGGRSRGIPVRHARSDPCGRHPL